MAQLVEERVTNLEEMMAQLIETVAQTSREMREFKEESRRERREFKEESRRERREFREESRREMREFREESRRERREFKIEMQDFKEEMRLWREQSERQIRAYREETSREIESYQEESRREMREFRKELGQISLKMGTMVEDMVAPSLPRILQEALDCPPEEIFSSAIRVKRRNRDGQLKEFDAIAVCGDYLFINETKSRLTPADVALFAETTLPTARDFFPEYSDKKLVGAIASLFVDESLVRYAERQGLIVLGFGQDVMDVLNSPEFTPRLF